MRLLAVWSPSGMISAAMRYAPLLVVLTLAACTRSNSSSQTSTSSARASSASSAAVAAKEASILDLAPSFPEPGEFAVAQWPRLLTFGMAEHVATAGFTRDSFAFGFVETLGGREGDLLTYVERSGQARVIAMPLDPQNASERAGIAEGKAWLAAHPLPALEGKRRGDDTGVMPPRPTGKWRYASTIEVAGVAAHKCDNDKYNCDGWWSFGGRVKSYVNLGATFVFPIRLVAIRKQPTGYEVHPDWIGLSPDGQEIAVIAHGFCGEYCDPKEYKVIKVDDFASQIFNDTAMLFHSKGDFQHSKELFLKAYQSSPTRSLPVYNLACALARLGDAQAQIVLQKAVDLDPKVRERAAKDKDFESVKATPWFVELTSGL